MSKKIGEGGPAWVHRSPVTMELYVTFVLPNNDKFKYGEKVMVGIIPWKDRPKP